MNPRWLLCGRCERTHRLGRACPPPVPATPWLPVVAEAYWVGLEVEMREARTLEIVGLAASLSRTRSGKMCRTRDEPGGAGTPRALAGSPMEAPDMQNTTHRHPQAHRREAA